MSRAKVLRVCTNTTACKQFNYNKSMSFLQILLSSKYLKQEVDDDLIVIIGDIKICHCHMITR